MDSRRASGPGRRWGEALLGGVAGLGARMLLAGAGRLLGFKGGPVAVVGGLAGVVGALVGGGLARRQRPCALGPSAEGEGWQGAREAGARVATGEVTVLEWESFQGDEVTLPRGPNGRERHSSMHEGSRPTA